MLDQLAPDITSLQPAFARSPEPRKNMTILTGAGASLYAGAPSTSDLTDFIAKNESAASILRALRAQKASSVNEINFEDVLHVLEELEVFTTENPQSREVRALKPFLNAPSAIGNFRISSFELRRLRFALIEAIGEQLHDVRYTQWRQLYSWIQPFFLDYDLHWYTLNYDLLSDLVVWALAQTHNAKYFNGFAGTLGTFRPDEFAHCAQLFGKPELTISHLHGSIGFNYRYTDPRLAHGQRLHIASPNLSLKEVLENWRTFHAAILAKQYDIGPIAPIISGLRKSEKLHIPPYGNYLHAFAQSLSSNPFLLMIGYGGGDSHINFWLRQYFEIHLRQPEEAHAIEINRIAEVFSLNETTYRT